MTQNYSRIQTKKLCWFSFESIYQSATCNTAQAIQLASKFDAMYDPDSILWLFYLSEQKEYTARTDQYHSFLGLSKLHPFVGVK